MELQLGPLKPQKFGIRWDIEDFKTHYGVADLFYGPNSHEDTQFEICVNQDPYISGDSVAENRWVVLLKKPHRGGFFLIGVKREVAELFDGLESEVLFGIKASFTIEFVERQDHPIITHIDSGTFTLNVGDYKEWEIPELNTSTHAKELKDVTVHVKLEIIPDILGKQDVTKEEEEAISKLEVLKVSNDIDTRLWSSNDSDADVDVPFSDLTIKVNEGEKTFKVHKCILAARSRVFKRMFENPKSNEGKDGTKTITGMSSDAVKHFLSFLYTGDFHLSDDDWADKEKSGGIVMQLMYAADKYEVSSLKALCDQELHNFCTPRNAYKMFDLCLRHDLTAASPKIEDFIEQNIVQILEEKKRDIQQA